MDSYEASSLRYVGASLYRVGFASLFLGIFSLVIAIVLWKMNFTGGMKVAGGICMLLFANYYALCGLLRYFENRSRKEVGDKLYIAANWGMQYRLGSLDYTTSYYFLAQLSNLFSVLIGMVLLSLLGWMVIKIMGHP